MKLLHKLLYRCLPLHAYLRVVSALFFCWQRLGIGRYAPATEYVYHLPKLVAKGDWCIDIGANLGYYTRTLSRLVGAEGRVYAVEPMPPMLRVLRHNLRRCRNVEILPYALGSGERIITMANDSARRCGYLGTGQNFVSEENTTHQVAFSAQMRRGSALFADCPRVAFIKCDVEGYEVHIMREMRPLLERFRPIVLIESGGENRPEIIALFTELGYRGYTLHRGEECPLTPDGEKDIIFRPQPLNNC